MRIFKRFASKNAYKFYDLVVDTPTRPQQPIEAMLMKSKDLKKLRSMTKTTFEGNYSLLESPLEGIEKIFGGRIRGDQRSSSSRLTRGEPRTIAGITVPDRPPEPDNCCMSGCINCVWELFRDDIKEWNDKRRDTALKINQDPLLADFVWPADFHPPLRYLDDSHIPKELLSKKHLSDSAKDPGAGGSTKDDDSWQNVPVAIRVFAEAEKKIKAKSKQKKTD